MPGDASTLPLCFLGRGKTKTRSPRRARCRWRPSTTTAFSGAGPFLKLTIRRMRGTISVDSSANWRKPMPRPTLEMPRQHIAEFCRRHHIRKLALFGSILRPDFRPDSDIDVLVEFEPGF